MKALFIVLACVVLVILVVIGLRALGKAISK